MNNLVKWTCSSPKPNLRTLHDESETLNNFVIMNEIEFSVKEKKF
jgi:hypothetical protein